MTEVDDETKKQRKDLAYEIASTIMEQKQANMIEMSIFLSGMESNSLK